MNTPFDATWMTSSLIIYAKLIMQIKVKKLKKTVTFHKICSHFVFSTLFLIIFLFEVFYKFQEILAVAFLKTKLLEKYKMAPGHVVKWLLS